MFDNDVQRLLGIILDKGFSGYAQFLRENAADRLDAWKQGAAANDAAAQFFLALHHAHDAMPNPLESLRLLQLAAEQGFAPAQTQLALHFEEGREIKLDMAEAVRWYTRSAEAGFV